MQDNFIWPTSANLSSSGVHVQSEHSNTFVVFKTVITVVDPLELLQDSTNLCWLHTDVKS